MNESNRYKKAQEIRSVIRYIQKFKNALVVIYIDDELIDSALFSSHMKDISLLHQAGIKIILIPGSRKKIDKILSDSDIKTEFKDGKRITPEFAMPQIKMAAFDISNVLMTNLASHQISATIGNWVRSRALGVIDGTDFQSAGTIEGIQTQLIQNILENGIIPIFPCIGWSMNGKPYNISSVTLAEKIAISLKADKLFFLMNDSKITAENFNLPNDIGVSEDGDVPALNLKELKRFMAFNKESEQKSKSAPSILRLLATAKNACENGVSRVHIVNGSIEGALPCEIFSDLGCGTMIYSQSYGNFRTMTRTDIPSVLRIMRPFIQRKILLPRTDASLMENCSDFVVYEIDGGIRACAALHLYDDSQAEIAAVTVDESFSHLGIGPMLVEHLIHKAKSLNLKTVFIMTTQAFDWFEKLGFTRDTLESLPEKRKALWSPERNSKVLRLAIK